MPLLRRLSSSRGKEHIFTSEQQDKRPSLLQRLSRRNQSHEHIQQESTPVNTQSLEGGDLTTSAENHELNRENYDNKQAYAIQSDGEANEQAPADGLSKEDVRALFFGAPHFMLERGRHGKAFPQAFFPWNSDLEVSDLSDRRYLSHESFSLQTLHAHLPIPDEMTFRPSIIAPNREAAWKRPIMDLGIFETPNMLHVAGREPGTIGLRYFLEIPVSEKSRTSEKVKQEEKESFSESDISRLSATDYLKSTKHKVEIPHIGKHAPRQDRMQLIKEGPQSWQRLGIRDIHASTIIQRLAYLSDVHDCIMNDGLKTTVLHGKRPGLYDQLFTQLIYPPEYKTTDELNVETDLKVQIETLVKILTTPGAWVDFSLVEPRIRLGQGLWQLPPYDDGADSGLHVDVERKWLMIQILLSIELLTRVFTALRLGATGEFTYFHLSGEEIHHFNKMRNSKIDWDLVMAHRFLNLLEVKDEGVSTSSKSTNSNHSASDFLSKVGKKLKLDEHGPSIWDCILRPRRANVQLQGLFRFARMIEWPRAESLEKNLVARWQSSPDSLVEAFAKPIPAPYRGRHDHEAANYMTSFFSGDDWAERSYLTLQPATSQFPGGWTSRSWFTGIAPPGEAGGLCIMSCLLENDGHALSKLGCRAPLHGGFVLDGRTWWHKWCIVSRVLAPSKGTTECMGWVNTPTVMPLDVREEAYSDTWLDVISKKTPSSRESSRIHDGQKLAEDSSVFGLGHGKLLSSEFSMVMDKILDNLPLPPEILVANLHLKRRQEVDSRDHTLVATLSFDMKPHEGGEAVRQSMALEYNVAFISCHPCRLPHGHTVFQAQDKHEQPHHQAHEHLPAHPLHKSYNYTVKSVLDVISSLPPDPTKHESATWIVDARGENEIDIFVRAWCSQIGRNALVARSCESCLSCAIREAKALEVGIIIRVGARASTTSHEDR